MTNASYEGYYVDWGNKQHNIGFATSKLLARTKNLLRLTR